MVGVNSLDKRHLFEKYLREAAVFPLYDTIPGPEPTPQVAPVG